MRKTKLPSLVTVLILTLITAVMWVSFEAYRLFNKPVPPSVPPEISNPLTPTLDKSVINQIESRLVINDSEIPDNVVSGTKTVNATGSGTPK